jgi:iron-sulfur cluster repair protein YtfE (RIC family)
MNALRLLKKDHLVVKRLFRRFEKTDLSDGAARVDLFHQIHEQLSMHTQVEEEILYPVLGSIGTQEAEDYFREAHDDHEEVRNLLAEMTILDPTSDEFDLTMGRIIESVEHHIEEEESGIFPLLKKYLARPRLRTIGERIEQRKDTLA